MFLLCRHLPFSFLPWAFLRAVVVSRKERGESEGGEKKLTDPFAIRSKNVELEVIQREEVGAGCLRQEGVSAAVGGGTLEGPWEGGVPATSSRRGGFFPYLP